MWRYTPMLRMYSGWHITADIAGCDSTLELLAILSSSSGKAHRTLEVSDPRPIKADQIFRDGHVVNVRYPTKLRMSFDPGLGEEDASLEEENDRLSIRLGTKSIREFGAGLKDLSGGEADFSIGFGNDRDKMQRLSFWWWPGPA